jgi:uncharacterized protein YkwD
MRMNGDETASTGKKSWLMGSLALNALLLLLVVLVLLWFSWPRTTESAPATELAAGTATPTPNPTETAVPDPSPTATALPPPAAVIQAPLPSPTPTPTETPIPPPEVTTTPEPTDTAVPPSPTAPLLGSGPDWLIYFNQIRLEGGLPYVEADATLSWGAQLHSEYMLRTNRPVHAQDINSPFYTREGNEAAQNSNIAASGWSEAPETWGISYWMTAPFHALPMLNPRLQTTGYGIYRDAASSMKMTATLDVSSNLAETVSVAYPLTFPRDGGQTWILSSGLPEYPNPLQSCPGFVRPVGAPLIVQIGPGNQTPIVSSSAITVEGTAVDHCIFTEATYYNEDSYQQRIGRTILARQDAIILIPRQPLEAGRTYSVSLVVNGVEIAWQFNTIDRRPPFEPAE